jgi:hypothetical protein
VLVRQDSVQPPLSPLYTGPFLVLERSLHFFKLQVGSRTDTVSCHRLKACHTPDNTAVAVPPRRGRPPLSTPADPPPPVVPPSLDPAQRFVDRPRRVSFAWPPAKLSRALSPSSSSSPSPQLSFHPSGRPARSVRRPSRYTS